MVSRTVATGVGKLFIHQGSTSDIHNIYTNSQYTHDPPPYENRVNSHIALFSICNYVTHGVVSAEPLTANHLILDIDEYYPDVQC
jgi:hypothetical protein